MGARTRLAASFGCFALVAALPVDAQPANPQGNTPAAVPPPTAAEAAYASHMQNGVKLFESGDFMAALVEFEAAYGAQEKPSPLINQALCHQRLGRYPKAVERLTLALTKHNEAMSEADRAGAQSAVEEMRALFATLRFAVLPDAAKITVNGDLITAEERKQGYWVGPGEHEVVISLEKYLTVTKRVTLASKQEERILVTLVPKKGRLTVVATKPTTQIKVDGKVRAKGSLDFEIASGQHTVELVGETGTGSVQVSPDSPVVIDLPKGQNPLPALPSVAPAPSDENPYKRGFYGGINGAILFPTKDPSLLKGDTTGGGYVGLRGGYRVHNYAAFEGMFEYGNVQGPADPPEGSEQTYSLSSFRLGPLLRLMSPGDLIHFVGTIGGGFAVHLMNYEDPRLDIDPAQRICEAERTTCGTNGVDIFVMTEVGAELDFDGVLIGLSMALMVSGTKGMEDDPIDEPGDPSEVVQTARTPYDNEVLPSLGPRVHIGYAFW